MVKSFDCNIGFDAYLVPLVFIQNVFCRLRVDLNHKSYNIDRPVQDYGDSK